MAATLVQILLATKANSVIIATPAGSTAYSLRTNSHGLPRHAPGDRQHHVPAHARPAAERGLTTAWNKTSSPERHRVCVPRRQVGVPLLRDQIQVESSPNQVLLVPNSSASSASCGHYIGERLTGSRSRWPKRPGEGGKAGVAVQVEVPIDQQREPEVSGLGADGEHVPEHEVTRLGLGGEEATVSEDQVRAAPVRANRRPRTTDHEASGRQPAARTITGSRFISTSTWWLTSLGGRRPSPTRPPGVVRVVAHRDARRRTS